MTDQKSTTGPPVALDRPAGQPYDLPKEANTRIVQLPPGKPRHDGPRQLGPTAISSSPQKDQPSLPAPQEASGSAMSGVGPTTVPPASSEEAPAPAGSKAPTRKVLAAGAGGGGIGVPLSVILGYFVLPPDTPPEVAAACSGLLVAILSFLSGYLTPPEQ